MPHRLPSRSRVAGVRHDTDTPLDMPSTSRALRLLGRTVLLRCPHCGHGAVLTRTGGVRQRCSGCNLRFERGATNYFSGAMFFGVMLGELAFAITFLIVLIATWPNVPWRFIQFAFPIGMALLVPVLLPLSKVVWVAFDVMVRPVQPHELL